MSRFADCLKIILVSEGGFSNDPSDPGGVTEHGITQRVYDAWRTKKGLHIQPVVLILDGEVSMIYYENYWIPSRSDKLPDPIDLIHFDTAVNSGVAGAGRQLQTALGMTVVDGIVGPKTLAVMTMAVASGRLFTVAMAYLKNRLIHYLAIGGTDDLAKFIRGWTHRIGALASAV